MKSFQVSSQISFPRFFSIKQSATQHTFEHKRWIDAKCEANMSILLTLGAGYHHFRALTWTRNLGSYGNHCAHSFFPRQHSIQSFTLVREFRVANVNCLNQSVIQIDFVLVRQVELKSTTERFFTGGMSK